MWQVLSSLAPLAMPTMVSCAWALRYWASAWATSALLTRRDVVVGMRGKLSVEVEEGETVDESPQCRGEVVVVGVWEDSAQRVGE